MYGSLEISTSGMVAQRTRMATIASNIANAKTMLRSDGGYEPYRRRIPVFEAGDPSSGTVNGQGLGVHVAKIEVDQTPFQLRYDPTSTYADDRGYVRVSNISPVVEQMNAMEASRAYEANVVAAETTKTMMAQALRLLA